MLGADTVITVWVRQTDPVTRIQTFSRHVIPACRYRTRTTRMVIGDGVKIGNSQVASLPAPDGNVWGLKTGDLVAVGEHGVEITGKAPYTLPDVLNSLKPRAFTVASITDATRARHGKHITLEGV